MAGPITSPSLAGSITGPSAPAKMSFMAGIYDAIRRRDIVVLSRELSRLSVTIRRDQIYRFMVASLTVCMKEANRDAAILIVQSSVNDTDGIYLNNILVGFLKVENITTPLISFIFGLYPDKSFREYGIAIIRDDTSVLSVRTFTRMEEYFGGDGKEEDYRFLFEYILSTTDEGEIADSGETSIDSAKITLFGYIRDRIQKTRGRYAAMPSWILKPGWPVGVRRTEGKIPLTGEGKIERGEGKIPLTGEGKIPPTETYPIFTVVDESIKTPTGILPYDDTLQIPPRPPSTVTLPASSEEAALIIKKSLEASGSEASLEDLIQIWDSSPIQVKEDLIANTQDIWSIKTDWDIMAFQVLGPLNTRIRDVGSEHNGRCSLYGGCRMFSCNEYQENDEEEDVEGDLEGDWLEWFVGHCEHPKCTLSIEKACYAFRIPLPDGGFYGCYCTPEHALDSYNGENYDRVKEFCDIILGQLDTHGIINRLYRGRGRIEIEE